MQKTLDRRSIDMLNGPILPKILLFILPLMATNLLQVLYNTADTIVVGLSSEANAVGAIGSTGAFANLVLNVVMGFTVGTNVAVAKALGAGERERVNRSVHSSVCICAVFGILASIIGISISRPVLLSIIGREGRLLDLAVLYARIYSLGVPFSALANCAISIFRAKGDTRTPLYVLSLTGLLNVCLNLFFVLVCGLSVEGVALATLMANATSAFILLFRLSRDEGPCRFSPKSLRFYRKESRFIIRMGIPAGIQGALFALSNMVIQSAIQKVNIATSPAGAAYEPVVRGNSAAKSLEAFIYTATNTVYSAAVSFTSQNLGAKNYTRIRQVILRCYGVTTCIALIFGSFIFLLKKPLLALYQVVDGAEGSLEAIAMDTATLCLTVSCTCFFLVAWLEVGSGFLRGLGRSMTSTVISLIGCCLFRLLWISFVFPLKETLLTVYLCQPISWVISMGFPFAIGMSILRRLKREQLSEEAPQATEVSA